MKLLLDDEFSPAGLKVLLVDDDPCCLALLERMLRDCRYEVRSCNRASKALCMLRDKTEEPFDLVISDVHMPDMDGYKLLELIGLEMDLPVIMMSANSDTNAVMKGIIYGACDYLIKPVRIEELRNIWQHVLRKRKESDFVKDSSEEWDDIVKADSRAHKRKRSCEEPLMNISNMKKARVVWSFELHQQFVRAIDHIGIDKAVPKRILEVMNIQGLTRENVASHLQKYRLYLKRLSGVKPQPFPVASFQAYGVVPGGTMHIQKAVPTSRSSSGCFQRLDDGTLASLAQLQAIQQAAHKNAPVAGPLRPVTSNTSPNAQADMHITTTRTVSVIQPSGRYDADIGLGSAYEELNVPSDVASFLHTVFPQEE